MPEKSPKYTKAQISIVPLRDSTGRLSDRIAAEIERQILLGRIEAGSQLPTEDELCKMFGVSRTVVRDAVRTVAARGLLEVQAGRGTLVLPPSDDSIGHEMLALLMRSNLSMSDVMDARAAIEIQLVPLAATRAGEAQRTEVARAYERFERAVYADDLSAAEATHLDFHLALFAATNLPALQLMLKPLQQVILLCSQPVDVDSHAAWDVDLHREIAAALESRDPGTLQDALQAHYAFLDDPAYRKLRAPAFNEAPSVEALLDGLLTRASAVPAADGAAEST